MRKPRDYKAEHARRSVTKKVRILGEGLSFWHQTNMEALMKLVPVDGLEPVIMSGRMPDVGVFQLLEIARVDPNGARDLLKRPEEISAVHTILRGEIAVVRPRRVSAADRIDRAWQSHWDRWLQKI